jgi:drug/metabolite transporter (DMT)-like permease
MLQQADTVASRVGNRLALAVALGLMLLWGSNYSVQKAVMAEIGPGAMVFVRYLVTPACAIALLLWQYGLRWPRLERREWMGLAGLAALGHVAHVNVMTQAMRVPWASLPASIWLALLWSLAVASFAGWLAWGWLNDRVGVPRTAPLLYLLPPVAGLISWMALGESFSTLKIAGAVMAGVGVAATQFGAMPARYR